MAKAKRTHDPAKPGPVPGHCGRHVFLGGSDQAKDWSGQFFGTGPVPATQGKSKARPKAKVKRRKS
jgi:hypothetical protein